MNFDHFEQLLDNSASVKLLRAESAPLILGFLYKTFKEEAHLTRPEHLLLSTLDDYLRERNSETERYPRQAKEYLNDWSNYGFLRNFYESDDAPIYELTPGTENVFRWLDDLEQAEFIGTESRLKMLFEKLKLIASKSRKDMGGRLKELEAEKAKIQKEIDEVKLGKMDVWDDRKVREEYMLLQETAKRLLSDFRQVEQNFREIDRAFRKQIISSNQVKGVVLTDLFKQQDFLWQTDQGKSFLAFWEFLLSRSMQEEFDFLLKDVTELPIMSKLNSDGFSIDTLRNNLIEAGDKTNKTTGGLLEQLRKYLEHKAFYENKKIHDNISEILRLVSESEDTQMSFLELDEAVNVDLILERPLFTPPNAIRFAKTDPDEGKATGLNTLLFEQFDISLGDLKNNIKAALKDNSQISLPELLKQFEVKKGVAEVIGYVEIASKNKTHILRDDEPEEIFAFNSKTNKNYKVQVPKIIFCK